MVRFSRREGLKLMLVSAYPGSIAAAGAASAAVTYDSLVNTFEPDVVSYWKFQNDGIDQKGTRNAIITGSPELNVETIVDLDTIADGADADGECIAWPGTSGVFAEAAHHADHKTPEGTIVVTLQRDSADQKSILVAADANSAAGGLSVEVTESGQPRAFLRRQSDGAPVPLLGQAGDVQLNEAYTLIFKWGPAGLSLALWDDGGALVRRLMDPLSDGVTGSSPIRFGTWHTDTDQHDGPYGRVIWLNRRISDAEEEVLARARTIARDAPGLALVGAWPLSETSSTTFADTVGGNIATLSVPSWTIPTHEHNRPGIVAGTDHALEVSNGGPVIPMIAAYKQAAMSLVFYAEPRAQIRGTQYWQEDSEAFGREFLAYCDDGSTPGSFAVYRRLFGTYTIGAASYEHRLGGYVRDGSGTKQYFGGSLEGVSGALLPIDTAKRIVLTQGPAGVGLWLDGVQVATLPAVTTGWTSLTTPITIGSSSDQGHHNTRSGFWGRVDEIRVYQGQLGSSDVASLPAAAQSVLYRVPTDGPLFNVNDFATLQAAMDAAAAGAGYVFQDASDATVHVLPTATSAGDNNATLNWKSGCRGIVGLRVRKGSNENRSGIRVIRISTDGGFMTGHTDPYAASGGYKLIGCHIDGNARGQDWHPDDNTLGFANNGFDLEQAHGLYVRCVNNEKTTFTVDACDFHDGTGDAISFYAEARGIIRSCRVYGYFRGPLVFNEDTEVSCDARRGEFLSKSALSSVINGCGLCDLEPFTAPSGPFFCQVTIADAWAEADWDDENQDRGTEKSWTRFYNCHTTGAGIQLDPSNQDHTMPVSEWFARYCTISYYVTGTEGSSNFPAMWFKGVGPGDAGLGLLFDHCVFLHNGRPYYYGGKWFTDPSTDTLRDTEIQYRGGGSLEDRIVTMRDCEFRSVRKPAGLPTSRTKAIRVVGTLGTGLSIELDGVLIDGAFADIPFSMGGITVRHRNVLHERTGSTTPWTNAGAEVPF